MWSFTYGIHQSWRILHGYVDESVRSVSHICSTNILRLPDVGGSQYLIDGKVKLKNDSQIKEFYDGGLRFEDGSELEADVVIFCTG